MNKPQTLTRKIAATLVGLALLGVTGSAAAALTIIGSNQNGASPFTSAFTVAADSLIAGQKPTGYAGNFTAQAAGIPVLTDGTVGTVTTGVTTNFATAGNSGGQMLIYNLPASTHGYNLTNITVFSGWPDGGRHAQAYTLYYSTVDHPTTFILLGNVVYDGGFHSSSSPYAPANPSVNRVVWSDSLGGVIATNVAAIKFDFTTPTSPYGENGYAGYAEITVAGPAATSGPVQTVAITTISEQGTDPFTPDFVLPSDNLIAGQLPTSTNGDFTLELSTRDLASLTAGGSLTLSSVIGDKDSRVGLSTCSANYLTFGGGGAAGNNAGKTLIYTLTNSPNGSDVTNIVVYSGWTSNGRMGQYYTVSYATISAPTTYIPVATVCYLPILPVNDTANRVTISALNGVPLGQNVASLKFDFVSPPFASTFDYGFQGFAQIIVEGTNSAPPPLPPSAYLRQDILPTHAETFTGDQIIFTAAYSNLPPVSLQWQKITSGPVTNNLSAGVVTITNDGVITSTLTLNNVQLSDTATYQLQGVNATNGAALPAYTAPASLVVSTPATLGGVVIQKNSSQAGPAGYYPPWTVDATSDLIYGFSVGAGADAGPGNFALESPLNLDPSVLSDGNPTLNKSFMVGCGWVYYGNPGQSMTYTLPGTTYGYDLTNITVYGGWNDDGRNEQKYQVLYSTVGASGPWISLGIFDYNPAFNNNGPNATRTMLVPAAQVLAKNVQAVQFSFNLGSKNNWNGYSEISLGGAPATALAPVVTQDITPLTAEDVVGSQLTLTAAFNGATSYQWQKNGVNLTGQTTTSLTLNNLQPTDAASYRLLAYNADGTNATRTCDVVVDPAPTPTGNVITALAYQTSDANDPLLPFTPTWDTNVLAASLIVGQNPPSGGFARVQSDFVGGDQAGGLPVLTDGNYGFFAYDGSHPAFAVAGPDLGTGQYVTYVLGANANGYTVTNIQVAGGWENNGRDSQFFTVLYSTVLNPLTFLPLASVANNLYAPGYGIGDETVLRTTITPAIGVLASNVYAIKVDFTSPPFVPNNHSGYSEISIFGSPSTGSLTGLRTETAANENLAAASAPTWILETPNLIAGQMPSATGAGNFANEAGVTGLGALTDGTFGPADSTASYATCGGANGAGTSLIYTCTNGSWTLTNIVVYSGWGNYNRDGQFYNITYATLTAPTVFLPLTSVAYNPIPPIDVVAGTTPSANRVTIVPANGAASLATNVYAIKFDFTPQVAGVDYGYSGYAEIVLQGSAASAVVIPPTLGATRFAGGNLIVTGTGGTPDAGYTWLSTTNLSAPVYWTTNSVGSLDGTGSFSNAIPLGSIPASYFRLRLP